PSPLPFPLPLPDPLPTFAPAFDRTGSGTLTAGNSSPITDGAAAVWVATDAGLSRLPAGTWHAELVDHEIAAVDHKVDGLLMAPRDRKSSRLNSSQHIISY